MAYASLQATVSRGGALLEDISPATTPTQEQVEEWLEEIQALIDAYVSGYGYTVPMTDPTAVQVLSAVNADGGAIMAIEVRFPTTAAIPSGQPSTIYEGLKARYEKAMDELRDGTHAVYRRLTAIGGVVDDSPGVGRPTSLWGEYPDEVPDITIWKGMV